MAVVAGSVALAGKFLWTVPNDTKVVMTLKAGKQVN